MRSQSKYFICAAALLWPLIEISGASNPKPQPDRVMYMSFQPGNWDIYLFNRPGKTPRRLTNYAGLDYDPVVSPDGRWLVFTSERRGNPDLYALDLKHGDKPHLLIDSERMEDQATFSPDGRFIYFVSTDSGNADIYRLSFLPEKTLSMKEAKNLTHNPAADLRPSISPDGRTMAFSSDRDLPVTARIPISRFRSGDIWAMNLDDRTLRRLTHMSGTGWNGSPKWSADGKKIVFYSSQYGSAPRNHQSRIMVMDADGSNQHPVTPWETDALSPEFLADGRILYARKNKQNRAEIVSVSPAGSEERIESDDSANSYWGPSKGPSPGSFVAFGTGPVEQDPPGGYHRSQSGVFDADGPLLVAGAPFKRQLSDREIDLYPIRYFAAILNPREDLILHSGPSSRSKPTEMWTSRIDGSEQHKILDLEPTPAQLTWAGMSWSKDGRWVAFTRGHTSVALQLDKMDSDVWKMRADGSGLQNLTPKSPGFDGYPSFSGDGKQIVFVSSRNGSLELYLMNADGSNVRRLTNDHAMDLFPTFSPASNQIAFVSNRDDPKSQMFDVYLLDLGPNGTPGRARRITHDEGQHGHTQFSYDGKWLVFASEAGGISDEQPLAPAQQLYGELYACRISDGSVIRLTDNKWEEGMASWEAPLPNK